MSEPLVDPAPAQAPENTPETPEIDWKAKAREWERRAKDNKSAADKLAELEEAQKSAEQKAAERLAEAERKVSDADFRVAVSDIATANGVPVDIATGPKERTADAVDEYVKSLLAWADGRAKPKGNYVPNEGKTAINKGDSEMRDFARQLFDSNKE